MSNQINPTDAQPNTENTLSTEATKGGDNTPKGQPILDTKSAWEVARECIQHEDNLIYHRTRHWIFGQGIIIAASGVITEGFSKFPSNAEDVPHPIALILVTFALCAIGLLYSLLTATALKAAGNQIERVVKWWETRLPSKVPSEPTQDDLKKMEFPNIIGTKGGLSTLHVVQGIIVIWALAIIGMTVIWMTRSPSTSDARAIGSTPAVSNCCTGACQRL